MRASRDGFALILVLLVVAAIDLVTIATLALARHETAAASASERMVVATRSAESMIRRFERAWPVAAVDSLAVMQTTTLHDSAGGALTVRRIAWGQYLVTATAPAGTHQIRNSALFERLDFER